MISDYPMFAVVAQFSTPYEVLSGVPRGLVLGPLFSIVFLIYLCSAVRYSNCLLLVDDTKIYLEINSPYESRLLKSDTVFKCGAFQTTWKQTSTKPESFPVAEKTNWIGFDYKLCESSNTLTDCVRDLGLLIHTKQYFRQQADNIFSYAISLLGLIRTVTFTFSSLHSLLTLHCTTGTPKLQCASVAWKFVTSSCSCKLERIQRQVISLSHHRSSIYLNYSYVMF
jgi:hypothetical protein